MFYKYKVYRNKICSLTRISKQQHYFTAFDANLTNMKETQWEGINNIIGRKSTNAKPINLVKTFNVGKLLNTVISDPIAISNIFIRHFASSCPLTLLGLF